MMAAIPRQRLPSRPLAMLIICIVATMGGGAIVAMNHVVPSPRFPYDLSHNNHN